MVPNHLANEDGPVVYQVNAFDTHLRGDSVPLGSSPTKSRKTTFGVSGPQLPFFISSSFVLSSSYFLSCCKTKQKNTIDLYISSWVSELFATEDRGMRTITRRL